MHQHDLLFYLSGIKCSVIQSQIYRLHDKLLITKTTHLNNRDFIARMLNRPC